jgi:glycerophosphoryl diester phosphodiesterase
MSQAAALLRGAIADLGATRRRVLLAGLVYKVLAFVIITPLASALLRLFVGLSGNTVLADQEIAFFLLSPMGVLALMAMGSIGLAAACLDQAAMMTIGFGQLRGAHVGALPAVGFAVRRFAALIEVGSRVLARCLLIAAPFLAVSALAYFALLTQHDINFYLTTQPPEFLLAAAVVGAALLGGALLIVRRLLGWALVLPILLFEGQPPAAALGESERRTAKHRAMIAATLIGWGVGATLIGAVPLVLVAALARLVVPQTTASMTLLVVVLSGLLALWAILNLLATLVTAATFALLCVRLYAAAAGGNTGQLPAGLVGGGAEWRGWRPSTLHLFGALLVAAGLAGVLGAVVLDDVRTADNVAVIAHRGASADAPENTLAAFALAIERGTGAVELDVQESADGEVVVIHDGDLMKVGGSPLRISEGTADELRAVDIGRWFGPEFTGQRVPTLAEVLELCRGRAHVLIELKFYGDEERLEERVIEIVERLGMEDEITTMSLRYASVQKMKELRPAWRAGLLTARAVGDLTTTSADFLAVNHGIASVAFVKRAHAAGKEVYVWTINDAINMSRMISRGADGLITDHPGRANEVIASRLEMNSAERLLLTAAFFVGLDPAEPPATEDTEG